LEGILQDVEAPLSRDASSPSAKFILLAALLLSIPALLPLGGALIVPYLNNRVPTGFIEYDLPSYLAEGRAYFDPGFHLTYGNPYAGYDTPVIYFQPQTILLGLMQQLGFDPGVTFNCFGLLALFFAAVVAVRFYIEVVGAETTAKRIGLVCFFWGGGIFTLVGLALALARGHTLSTLWQFEPTWGWWMLNFGRNLVYPTEAYYHGVFLLSILFLFRRQLAPCLTCAALLCCSHPFSGLELILILIAYSAVELVLRSGAVTFKFLFGSSLIAALHMAYYMIWLNRFSDHRILQLQWQKAWLYRPKTIVGALIIVGCLAIWRLASSSFSRLNDPRNRLFAVWFLVIIALTQHQLVMRPLQPIHFAHGYDWMALFFLGSPALIELLDSVLRKPRPLVRMGALALIVGILLLDNTAWLIKTAVHNEFLVLLSRDESDALGWLSQHLRSGDMVICQDTVISYLVPVYSQARAWQGHEKNTPYLLQRRAEIERAFSQGLLLPEWKRKGVVYVSPAAWSPPAGILLEQRYGNSEFSIWTVP